MASIVYFLRPKKANLSEDVTPLRTTILDKFWWGPDCFFFWEEYVSSDSSLAKLGDQQVLTR